jgi:dUTP pyrophosphatase
MPSPLLSIPVKILPHGQGLSLPAYATAGAAGMDLRCALPGEATLAPGERQLIPTGLAFAIPRGFEGQVRPRSGLATRHGLTVLNAPGTVDSDYRGEVCVLLINLGTEPVVISRGDRVAQLIFAECVQGEISPVEILDETSRGGGGFGHTGRS